MNKKIKGRLSVILLTAMLLGVVLSATSCFLVGTGENYTTREEVQQMMDNTMSGNITVEGGDNYNVTINGAEQNHAAAGRRPPPRKRRARRHGAGARRPRRPRR